MPRPGGLSISRLDPPLDSDSRVLLPSEPTESWTPSAERGGRTIPGREPKEN